MNTLNYFVFKTKLGWVGIAGHQTRIREIILPGINKEYIVKRFRQSYPKGKRSSVGLKKIIESLKEYLSGQKKRLSFPIDLSNYSTFERKVYQTLKKVQYGEVRDYNWLAQHSGHPRAVRAVGNALAKNLTPLVIPCHRIIRHDGRIGSFSAPGGARLKAKLLALEKNGHDR